MLSDGVSDWARGSRVRLDYLAGKQQASLLPLPPKAGINDLLQHPAFCMNSGESNSDPPCKHFNIYCGRLTST